MALRQAVRSVARPLLAGGPSATTSAILAQSARRSYATVPPVVPEPKVVVTETTPIVKKQKKTFRQYRQTFGRATLGVVTLAAGGFLLATYLAGSPGEQLPQDPKKKNVVVLGSGWGATAFLKALDTEEYNVTVISPHNYFLYTPLLPSVTVGTLEARSIIQPTRFITRHKKRKVNVIEAEAQEVDPVNKTVKFVDTSDVIGTVSEKTISYDYLVYAVGCENQTFGMAGVPKYACFLKELADADKVRTKLMDCIESAAFPGQTESEIDRLMHMVVVGGGPTGVEYAGELHDFLIEDLRKWYPEVADRLKITLVEALPNVLPMFSKKLIEYTESTFNDNKINLMTKTMVKEVNEKHIVVQDANKEIKEIPYGLLVWATGNTPRTITRNLMAKLSDVQTARRGLSVDDNFELLGGEGIFAIGDNAATKYAPTAQVAGQQGTYLAKTLKQMAKRDVAKQELDALRQTPGVAPEAVEQAVKKLNKAAKIRPFHYSHQGSLAYIGSDKAIADLPLFGGADNLTSVGGQATYWFWRSAYVSNLYSLRNRTLVMTDWVKVKLFGRDVSRE